jgi:hypothetical protein
MQTGRVRFRRSRTTEFAGLDARKLRAGIAQQGELVNAARIGL